jgi:Domain of unknown function (DUF4919)
MKIKSSILLIALLLCSFAAFGQKPEPPKSDAGLAYNELVNKIKAGDTAVDFKALRIAFSKTKDFSPYGSSESTKAAFPLIDQKKYKDAVKKADEGLKESYVDMDAHVAASVAYRGLGDTAKADFHKAVYLGLVNSIISSGDGKTPETAYVVISTKEEYITLRALGLPPMGQSLNHINGHSYDIQKSVDPKTKAEMKIYFNIDIVWKAANEIFKD